MPQLLDKTPSEANDNRVQRIQRMMVVKWSDSPSLPVQETQLTQFVVLNILEDLIGKTGTVLQVAERTFGLVLYATRQELSDEAMECFQTFIRSCLAKYAKLEVQIGIGDEMDTFLDLNKSLSSAMLAIEQKSAPITSEPESHPFVEEAKAILQKNCGDGMCLKTIAKQLFVNPAYLGRLFKAYGHITFNEYLIQVRMEKAKALLKTTDMRIYEIASEVGYRQLDWFYKKFKEYTGYSAKEFKIKHL